MKLVVGTINNILCGRLRYLSRFSMVGVINTLVDFMMFTTFHELFKVSYTLSQVVGYGFGVVNSFILNRNWTFDDRSSNKKTFHELIQFIVVNLISLAVTLAAMNFLIKNLNLNVYVSKAAVTIIAQITNYFGYKLWVFI